MFQTLTERLSTTLKRVTGKSKLTEDNIRGTLKEVRIALIEADVALSVVKTFINEVRKRAIGSEVKRSLNPGQMFVKIVNDELVNMMGEYNETLNLNTQPPAIILMAGLQGVGKTTTVAKLGLFLKENHKKSVMVVSTDVYRPAAIKQLEMLTNETPLHFFPSSSDQKPVDIASDAIHYAKINHYDTVIIDTAGRLHVDEAMMDEIKVIHKTVNPAETLFIVDAMTGQDAANTAKAFNDALPLTGVILTKADGDARGGAALSVRKITGKPIKFIGVGEKTDALEAFHPERMASRILGMGDILSLIEVAEKAFDKKKTDHLIKKFKKGKSFNFDDFRSQIQQMKKMGNMGNLLDKLPGVGSFGQMAKAAQQHMSDSLFDQMEAIINSMTPKERQEPDVISSSRKRRIAAGSGTQVQDVGRLLKQLKQMSKVMKKVNSKGPMKFMQGFQGMKNMMNGNGNMSAMSSSDKKKKMLS
ncbi:MAG: signal recognition particle protein [Endozoicomonadaceae bacterium]|nr:signal recognition particle protein [Endozoicomonadaceae bacterium]MCY4329385.1 signal recognition particle protein [Endozoicomonadaceae bacterium]